MAENFETSWANVEKTCKNTQKFREHLDKNIFHSAVRFNGASEWIVQPDMDGPGAGISVNTA